MLGEQPARSEILSSRLIVEPPVAIRTSVLPAEDDERAADEAAAAGIPPDLLAHFGASIRQTHQRANVVVIDVPPERQAALADALRAIGIPARPPLPVQAMLNESVPALHVPPVWAAGFRGAGIRVAIIDTGVDLAHPDVRERVAAHADFTGVGDLDDVGHGTHVAGIIAGGGAVYRGVAPEASLIIAKALSANGGTEDAVLAALSWASRQDVQVMNLSLGGLGSPTSPLAREVDALAADGVLVCVAAGNGGPNARTISSPGDARGALTVGATDKTGRLAFYSSRGPVLGVRYRKPEVLAIGGGATSGAACAYGSGIASARAAALAADPCAVPPRYVRMSGTSMATPHVAGICALLLEATRDRKLSALGRAKLVRRAVIASARRGGLVDAERALAAAYSGGSGRRESPATSPSSPLIAKMAVKLK